MSNETFINLIRSEESDFLQEHHPNAFLLLTLIAKRARRVPGLPDGLEIGEAFIGDFKKAGIETERKYRTAKSILIKRGHIKISETCRNVKKSTTEATTKNALRATTYGTLVILLNSEVWDINPETSDDLNKNQTTTQTTTDRRRTRKNKNEIDKSISKKKNNKKEKPASEQQHENLSDGKTIIPLAEYQPESTQHNIHSQPEVPNIQRRHNIFTSEKWHSSRIEKYDLEIIERSYDKLSQWKDNKSLKEANAYTDEGRLDKWVLKSVDKEIVEEREIALRKKVLNEKEKNYENNRSNIKNSNYRPQDRLRAKSNEGYRVPEPPTIDLFG